MVMVYLKTLFMLTRVVRIKKACSIIFGNPYFIIKSHLGQNFLISVFYVLHTFALQICDDKRKCIL